MNTNRKIRLADSIVAISLCLLLVATLSGSAAFAQDRQQTKTLTGTVMDHSEAPIQGAVVYLKNTKTLAVKSYISNQDGGFQFHGLSPNVDYEVHAESNGQRSSTRSVSSFDSKSKVEMTLKIDVKK